MNCKKSVAVILVIAIASFVSIPGAFGQKAPFYEQLDLDIRIGVGVASAPDALAGALVLFDAGATGVINRWRLPVDVNIGLASREAKGFTFDESADRCRSNSTGRFVETSNCTIVEGAAWIGGSLMYDVYTSSETVEAFYMGVGGVVGATTGPHGVLGMRFPGFGTGAIDLQAQAGLNRVSLTAALVF